jgi:hypothetical protein
MPLAEKLRIATWNSKSSDLERLAYLPSECHDRLARRSPGEKMVDTLVRQIILGA